MKAYTLVRGGPSWPEPPGGTVMAEVSRRQLRKTLGRVGAVITAGGALPSLWDDQPGGSPCMGGLTGQSSRRFQNASGLSAWMGGGSGNQEEHGGSVMTRRTTTFGWTGVGGLCVGLLLWNLGAAQAPPPEPPP